MKLKRLLEELNEAVPFTKKNKYYYFTIADNNYRASFFKHHTSSNNYIQFGFQLMKNKKEGTIDLTNTGHVKKVFSTVLNILKDYEAENKPKYLAFQSNKNEPSRVRFYNLLVHNIHKYADNYILDKIYEDESENNIVFLIKRKN